MVAITQYYAKVGLSVDMAQLKKVDRYLSLVEKKLLAFQKKHIKQSGALNLKISIDEKSLVKKLGDALDRASSKVVIELKNFHINQQALSSAFRRAGAGTSVGVGGRSSGIGQLPASEWNRREATRTINRLGEMKLRQEMYAQSHKDRMELAQFKAVNSSARSSRNYGSANLLHAGGGAGAIARYGVGALPFVGGVYGIQQLNQANQNMMSANIAAESVLGEQAGQRMDWLSQRSNYLGVNYAETLPQFTKFMASASPLLGGDSAQEVFSGFMQFGRTRGATGVSMNRALNAVAQMGAKGQIMQEELKGQLAEASGFGELPQLFAEAYQIQSGGSLKGPEARAALMKAMEDGLVKADILPIVTKLMNELSKGGIEKARTSSVAEQARAENALTGRNGLLQVFSKSGGEEGFAKFWKIMAEGIKANEPLVRGLAGAFKDLMTGMEAPLQLVKDFNAGLSDLSEQVGLSESALVKLGGLGAMLMTKWGRLGFMFATIAAVLQDLSRGIQGKNSYTKDVIDWVGTNSTDYEERKNNPNDPLGRKGPLADWWQQSVRPSMNQLSDSFNHNMERASIVRDPNSIYYNDPKGYDDFVKQRQLAAIQDSQMTAQAGATTITFGDINVTLPTTAEGDNDAMRAQMFANMLQNAINEAMPNFNLTQ